MQGVEQFGDFAIQIRMKMMTKPGEQFVIRRKAYAMIKKAFDANGIQFAFPTVQVAGPAGPMHGGGRRAPGAGARQGRGREVNALLLIAVATGVTGLEHDLPATRNRRPRRAAQRREIRVLVPYSRTLFFNDKGEQRGLTADTLQRLRDLPQQQVPRRRVTRSRWSRYRPRATSC